MNWDDNDKKRDEVCSAWLAGLDLFGPRQVLTHVAESIRTILVSPSEVYFMSAILFSKADSSMSPVGLRYESPL